MKTLYFLLVAIVFTTTANSQTNNNTICQKMGKIKVVYKSNFTKDSLVAIQEKCKALGVSVRHDSIHLNENGKLDYVTINVKCEGCNLQGGCVLDKTYFNALIQNKGFGFNHDKSPSFLIGGVLNKF